MPSLLLAALLAGAVAILATVAVERLGGRAGGVLASVPTTIVPASVGFWLSGRGVEAFTGALAAVPGGLLVDALFLLAWRVLPPRLPPTSVGARLAVMVVASLGLWSGAAVALVLALDALEGTGVPPLASGAAFGAALVGTGVVACLDAPPAPKGSRPVPAPVLAGRGVLAAVAIGVSVLLARQGAPLIAGVASVFPANFLTTMVSLWVAQGEAVPVGAVGPIVLGSSSVAAYALLAAATFPALGPAVGAVAAWLGAVACTSVPAAAWLRTRRSS